MLANEIGTTWDPGLFLRVSTRGKGELEEQFWHTSFSLFRVVRTSSCNDMCAQLSAIVSSGKCTPSLSRKRSRTGRDFLNHTELSASTLAFDWSAGIHSHTTYEGISDAHGWTLPQTFEKDDDSTKGAGAVPHLKGGSHPLGADHLGWLPCPSCDTDRSTCGSAACIDSSGVRCCGLMKCRGKSMFGSFVKTAISISCHV